MEPAAVNMLGKPTQPGQDSLRVRATWEVPLQNLEHVAIVQDRRESEPDLLLKTRNSK